MLFNENGPLKASPSRRRMFFLITRSFSALTDTTLTVVPKLSATEGISCVNGVSSSTKP